jgi:hypothetical protein
MWTPGTAERAAQVRVQTVDRRTTFAWISRNRRPTVGARRHYDAQRADKSVFVF